MKSNVIIGNNSKVAQSIGHYLSHNFKVYYTGRSGKYDFYLDLQSSPLRIQQHPNNIDAVIATNTTLDRDQVEHLQHGHETGV